MAGRPRKSGVEKGSEAGEQPIFIKRLSRKVSFLIAERSVGIFLGRERPCHPKPGYHRVITDVPAHCHLKLYQK